MSAQVPASRVIPTSFMIDLKKRLMNEGLAESTVKVYLTNLVIMNNGKPFKSALFLKSNIDYIFTYLEEKADNTRMTYLSSAIATMRPMKDESIYKTAFKRYVDEMNIISGEQDKIDPNEKTQREADNWIDWTDVEKRCDELKSKVMEFKDRAPGTASLTEKEFSCLLDWVCLGMYVYMNGPRRNRDFLELQIYQDEPKEDLAKSKNYYIPDGENSAEFIFNVYKTSKFEGQTVLAATPEMIEMMKIWTKFHPLNKKAGGKTKKGATALPVLPLFVNIKGDVLTSVNFITLRLNKIFKKKVGASMLRHSFLTYKFGDVVEEMKEISENMSHSTSQQKDYIKK
jgi:hypothetical protein